MYMYVCVFVYVCVYIYVCVYVCEDRCYQYHGGVSDDGDKDIIVPVGYFGPAITVYAAFAMPVAIFEFAYVLDPTLIAECAEAME